MKTQTVLPQREILSIPAAFARAASTHPENVALRMRRIAGAEFSEISYGELLDAVTRIATALKGLGLQSGDRVALVGENNPEWPMSYLAVQWAGGVVLPLDAKLTPDERSNIIRHAEPKLMIASSSFEDEIESAQEHVKGLVGIPMNRLGQMSAESEPMTHTDTELEDLAVIIYTSGTTGSPKGVMLSHKNISSNIAAALQVIDIEPRDNFFSVLPLHHVFEATAGMLLPLTVGATITYSRSLKPNEIREDLEASQATLLVAVPLLLEKVLKGIHRGVRNAPLVRRALFRGLSGTSRLIDTVGSGAGARKLLRSVRRKAGMESLRYVVSGGAALPPWVSEGLQRLGFTILQGYGLSETSPALTFNTPMASRNASVGPPLPGIELRIDDPDAEGNGEIIAKGATIMTGYFKNPDATAEMIDEAGWLHTGDLGRVDSDGFYHITGRKRSIIVTPGGKNIYPEEVEEALQVSPLIEEALVLRGWNERTDNEQVEAIIFPSFEELHERFAIEDVQHPTDGQIREAIGEEIKRYTQTLAAFKRPKIFSVREEEFPKTTTRKIKRYLFERKISSVPSQTSK